MAEVLGPQTILSKALATGTDAAIYAQYVLRDGSNFQSFLSDLSLAIGDWNEKFLRDYGGMINITEEPMMEYPNGGAVSRFDKATDVSKVDAVHGTTISHMIDLTVFQRRVGGTKRFFRDTRRPLIESMISTVLKQAEETIDYELLWRLMTDDEVVVGSTGYNVGFVTSSGSVVFTPPSYRSRNFANHTHYLGYDSDTGSPADDFADVLNGLALTLAEHGHEPPFTARISSVAADLDAYRALDKFVDFTASVVTVVDRGSSTTGANFYANGQPMVFGGVMGYFQSTSGLVEIRPHNRIPTGFAAMYKSYGNNDPRNPLALRIHSDAGGFGLRIIPETTDDKQYPVQGVTLEMEFGVSAGRDRTNGAVARLSTAGTWEDPTIS